VNVADPQLLPPAQGSLRHVTLFFSSLAGLWELNQRLGDVEASRLANRWMTLQEIIITRDGLGQIMQFAGEAVFAVFETPSAAINRALEIQRILDTGAPDLDPAMPLKLRIGLHTGEVLIKEGERLEIISRHVNRAHRVMEAAAPGQILASEVVVEAAKDFIDIPKRRLAIQYFGEYSLKGVGATSLCEVADTRFRKPEAPRLADGRNLETALMGRLELAGYRPVRRLGEGASGVVYQAEQNETRQKVAIKVLPSSLSDPLQDRERLLRELDRLRELGPPGIGSLIAERLDHQPPFLVMEWIEGKPVDVALAESPARKVAQVFQQICSVLERTHAVGLFHGNLKPENVLVQENGRPIILDFGLATLSESGARSAASPAAALGTPAYQAPEVIQGSPRSAGADLYSVGIMLFKVLTGREPFVGDSIYKIVQAQLHEDPPLPAIIRPGVEDGLQRICLKALEKNPADRYSDARAMADDLGRYLRGETVRTRPTAYDNQLFHRVHKQVAQVKEWADHRLLSPEEADRLLSSYEFLMQRGIPAVMEGRVYRLWQTLVYAGGWAVVNGSLLWLVQHWSTLRRGEKLLLGSVPALTSFVLALAMWKLERFRLTFVALIVGILAVPLLVGVWLNEYQVASSVPAAQLEFEVFHTAADSTELTNRQIEIISLITLAVAAAVMVFTQTKTHSAQALLALFFCYSAGLLFSGLKLNWENSEWAAIALKYLPLLLLVGGLAWQLLDNPARQLQAGPWIYFAAALLTGILFALSRYGLQEWTNLRPEIRDASAYLLMCVAGGLQATVGLLARRYLRHRCRWAALAVTFVGLVGVLAALGLAGVQETWPKGWWAPRVYGQAVAAPHLALPLASIVIAVLACRFQMVSFLFVGLLGFAASVHLLGYLYFENVVSWPKTMMVAGAICFFAALWLELRRTRGNAIDDVVSQTRL
jgi:serine/threonine protein kinase/class 3 adenylate cyclase